MRSWSWLPFFAPHCEGSALLIAVGDLLVVDVDDDEAGHQVGFFVGHVVARPGFLDVVVIGFNVPAVECVGRPGDGGWVGSGGIV